jgi:hypothetical protein
MPCFHKWIVHVLISGTNKLFLFSCMHFLLINSSWLATCCCFIKLLIELGMGHLPNSIQTIALWKPFVSVCCAFGLCKPIELCLWAYWVVCLGRPSPWLYIYIYICTHYLNDNLTNHFSHLDLSTPSDFLPRLTPSQMRPHALAAVASPSTWH